MFNQGVGTLNQDMRKLNQDMRKLNQGMRKLNQGMRKLNQGVRKLNRVVRKFNRVVRAEDSTKYCRHSGECPEYSPESFRHSGECAENSPEFFRHSGECSRYSPEFFPHSGESAQDSPEPVTCLRHTHNEPDPVVPVPSPAFGPQGRGRSPEQATVPTRASAPPTNPISSSVAAILAPFSKQYGRRQQVRPRNPPPCGHRRCGSMLRGIRIIVAALERMARRPVVRSGRGLRFPPLAKRPPPCTMAGRMMPSPNTPACRSFRRPLIFGLASLAFILFSHFALRRLHARGHLQVVLGPLNGVAHLLQLPGFTVAQAAGLRPGHRMPPAAWAVVVAVTFLFYTALYDVIARVWSRLAWRRPGSRRGAGADRAGASPEDAGAAGASAAPSRRRVILWTGRATATAVVAAGGYAFGYEPRSIEVTTRRIPIRNLPEALDGLRIVQITDVHHGPWTSLAEVRRIVGMANDLRPDLVALTGDYVHRGPAYIAPVVEELAKLRPQIGMVGVLGNHDWWESEKLCRTEFERHGIPLIDNARLFITRRRTMSRDAGDGLCIAGVGDLWEDVCDYAKALGQLPRDMPRILLSHNPDVAEEPAFRASGLRADLMISGHTHGGQVRVPGYGPLTVNSRHGRKYAAGLVQGPVCPVYICRGLGMTVMPVRFACRPEIAVIELTAATGADQRDTAG